MTPVLLVHGTWSADFNPADTAAQWWLPGSPLAQHLATQGLDVAAFEPFRWSGDLVGVARFYPWNWFRKPQERDWQAAAQALRYLLEPRGCPVPYAHRNVVAHSHGGQPVFYACANGLKIRRLVTVGTPVRADMAKVIEAARPNIEEWWHVVDPQADRTQLLGEFGDGRIGWTRHFLQADKNIDIPGAGHSRILTTALWFWVWTRLGLVNFLRDASVAEAA